jgi:hypothetical protein
MATTTDFVLNIIPSTIFDAFAKGEILQVLLIAVLFGFALHRFGGRGTIGVRLDREELARAVHDGRLHHEGGPDRRLWRHGIHHRQVRPWDVCCRWAS